MEYIEHLTAEGERWDLLAHRYYGDPFRFEAIIVANPQAPIAPILPAGIKLAIPVLEEAASIAQEDLPPWKR